jgi:glycosyltransferase involved in cell wall biosynthesis
MSMNEHGQSFCLNMIVKNEARVIGRCLDSARPIIDFWVIVDTGSTDGTQEAIRRHLDGLPGELIERPWVDFAHNRSEAVALARGRADYVLVIDADETLEIPTRFKMPRLTADSYDIEVRCGTLTYARKQLLRNSLPWRYDGILHEHPRCDEARSEEFLPGTWFVSHSDGARSRDPQSCLRDAQTLEKAIRDEPNNTRYVFYLAQTNLLLGDFDSALNHYRRRVEMGGHNDEVWFSLYRIAQLEQTKAKPWPEVMQHYLTAYEFMPDRAGPLFHVGMNYQARGDHGTAHQFFCQAMSIPPPANNRLFVERHIYEYLLPLEYAVACHYVGEYAAAIATYNGLLRQGKVPAMLIDRVIANRRFSIDALKPPSKTPAGSGQIKICVAFQDAGPELDECIESILRQDLESFTAAFIDDGSSQDHSARIPLEDSRFSLLRHKTPVGSEVCLCQFIRRHCGADDLVLVLRPQERFAEVASLGKIRAQFESSGCLLLYGQHRMATGELGDAEPAPDAAAHNERGAALAGRSPVFFRARLALASEQVQAAAAAAGLNELLMRAAGFPRSFFSDTIYTVLAEPGKENRKLQTSKRVERGLAEPAKDRAVYHLPPAFSELRELPRISCLMVSHGRLALARRAIRCYADQTYPKRELVIVSDGQLRYRRGLERYVAHLGLDSVRFVYSEADRLSLSRLRNISLDAADGDLICQWDDDDCYHPERLALQLAYILESNARACCLTDHLQLLEADRQLVWVDWTLGGRSGQGQLLPGTIMAFKDRRFRYPETGPYVHRGEDSVFLDDLYRNVLTVPLSGMGHIYLYTYHGGNTFSREHHYNLRMFSASRSELNEKVERIRQAIVYYPVPRPITVVGRDGAAFVLNERSDFETDVC